VTITSGPDSVTASREASFGFTADDPDAVLQCSLDGAPMQICTSPQAYTELAYGDHTFEVQAIAQHPLGDWVPALYEWTIEDQAAPDTTIVSGPPAESASTSATFEFTGSDNVTPPASLDFECSLDTGGFGSCTSPHLLQGLAVGRHDFRVRAVDAAGNPDGTPAIHAWTISSPCAGSTVTLGASADSWVLQSSSSSNYGNDSAVKVDTKAGANARVLVRFSLPAIPSGCQVTSARLRLYAGSYKTGRTLQALRVSAPWTESALTWANQPATSGSAATVASGSGYREWTVSQQVQAMYSGSNNGFLVRDAAEGGPGIEQAFNSREKGTDNPPRLVITFG
jgi:large repetitive protein